MDVYSLVGMIFTSSRNLQSSEEESSESDEEMEEVKAAALKPAVSTKGNAVEAEESEEDSDEV